MIYPSDFNYHFGKSDVVTHGKNASVTPVINSPQNNFGDKIQTEEIHHSNVLVSNKSIWVRYCNNSTVHGLRYFTNTEIHYTER